MEPVAGSSSSRITRVAEHGHGHAEPLAHAERETARPWRRCRGPTRSSTSSTRLAGRRLGLGQEQQAVTGRTAWVHGLGLEQRADRVQRILQVTVAPAVDESEAALRPVQAQDQPHGGGLAAPFGPRNPVTRPGSTVKDRWSTAALPP